MNSGLPVIDVYPYRWVDTILEFLILKRAPKTKYANQWRMVGGKVEKDEKAWQAGLRELHEETSCLPLLYWAVPSLNQFYESQNDAIYHIPVFAAEIAANDSITLNGEHTESRWVESAKIQRFIFWPEHQRLMLLIDKILTTQNVLEDWKIAL